jgi:hypothetical protein
MLAGKYTITVTQDTGPIGGKLQARFDITLIAAVSPWPDGRTLESIHDLNR